MIETDSATLCEAHGWTGYGQCPRCEIYRLRVENERMKQLLEDTSDESR